MLRSASAAPLLGLAAFLLVPLATAQTADDDGCTQRAPCEIQVNVDGSGIVEVSVTSVTSGDWFFLSVSNEEDRTHTVTFAGMAVEVPGFEERSSQPFAAGAPGTHKIHDEPTGDEADVLVLEGDVVEAENEATGGAQSDGKGTPSLAMAGLAVALVAVAGLRRH